MTFWFSLAWFLVAAQGRSAPPVHLEEVLVASNAAPAALIILRTNEEWWRLDVTKCPGLEEIPGQHVMIRWTGETFAAPPAQLYEQQRQRPGPCEIAKSTKTAKGAPPTRK
jgi:hypothetical protein